MSGGEGFIFDFLFGKTLRESSQAVVVRRNADCRKICAVASMIEYRQAAVPMQSALAEGSGFLFRSVLGSGAKGNLAMTPAQITVNLQTHYLRKTDMEDKRYTLRSFRVGGSASHHIDGTAVNVLTEYVGWRSSAVASKYYVGVTASTAASGSTKCFRDTAFIQTPYHCRRGLETQCSHGEPNGSGTP